MYLLQCLYEAGKFHKMQLLDIFCEALDPDFSELRASNYISGEGIFFSKPSSADHRMLDGENSSLKKGTFIAQAIHRIRYVITDFLAYVQYQVHTRP